MLGIDTALVLAVEDRMGGDEAALFEDTHLAGVVLHLQHPAAGGVGLARCFNAWIATRAGVG